MKIFIYTILVFLTIAIFALTMMIVRTIFETFIVGRFAWYIKILMVLISIAVVAGTWIGIILLAKNYLG